MLIFGPCTDRITRTSFCYVSRGDCISRVTEIRLTSPELSKADNIKTNKITQPLHLPSYLNQTIRLPSYHNQTIRLPSYWIRPYTPRVMKSFGTPALLPQTPLCRVCQNILAIHLPSYQIGPPELMNQTIHLPSYEKFWHTCIITPDPLCAKVPKLICISRVVTWVEG